MSSPMPDDDIDQMDFHPCWRWPTCDTVIGDDSCTWPVCMEREDEK